MKNLFLSVAFAFSAMAHANIGPSLIADPAINGSWQSTVPVFSTSGMSIFMGLEFGDSTVVMSSICKFNDGKVLEAKIAVQAEIGGGKITTNSRGDNEVKDGDKSCTASVVPGSLDYVLAGAILRLSSGGHAIDFVRR